MRETLLSDALSQPTYLSEAGSIQQIKRRQFLQTLGITSIGLAAVALSSKDVFAQCPDEVGLWRDHVTGFIYSVCNDRRAQAISSQLSRASIYCAPSPTDFHSYYSAPLIFVGTTISPEEVICGNGFEVNRFPYYDVQCPCRGINDLNAFEIRSVTHKTEIDRFGCVLAPHSIRSRVEYYDHADYNRTASAYGVDTAKVNVEYKRVFTGKGKSRYGYHIADKTRVGSNGKPFRDVLLSSSDI
jgi:hypothetical protein